MRDKVYFLVFDGCADWQVALALCEIRRPGDWRVQAVGMSNRPVVSMSGLTVQPDLALGQVDTARAAMLIVPGGYLWLRSGHVPEEIGQAVAVLRELHAAGAAVAGIDSGVLMLARARLLDQRRHTGNGPGQLAQHVPGYAGADQYDGNVLAASDAGVISASHVGNVEFAREVIDTLGLYGPSDRDDWYRLFKHGQLPAWCPGEPALTA